MVHCDSIKAFLFHNRGMVYSFRFSSPEVSQFELYLLSKKLKIKVFKIFKTDVYPKCATPCKNFLNKKKHLGYLLKYPFNNFEGHAGILNFWSCNFLRCLKKYRFLSKSSQP